MATSLRQLQALLDFTDTDLNANRKGKLSADQTKMLQQTATNELKAMLLFPTLLGVAILTFLELRLALPVLLVLMALGVGIYSLHQEQIRLIKQKKVSKISGYLDKTPLRNGIAHYYIRIGDEELPVERHLYEQLPQGKYVVYLLEDTHQLLGMEPVKQQSNRRSNKPAKKEKRATSKKSTSSKSTTRKRAATPSRGR